MRILLSAERKALSPALNAQRTSQLKALLKAFHIPHKRALGRFEGIDETSFLIEASAQAAASTLQLAVELARSFDQECLLALNEEYRGTLIDKSGQAIGRLEPIEPPYVAAKRPEADHTAIPLNDGRFLVIQLKAP